MLCLISPSGLFKSPALAVLTILLSSGSPAFSGDTIHSELVEDSVRFEVFADRSVVIPAPGESSRATITLRITNLGTRPLQFRFVDTVWLSLTDPEGRLLPMDGGRDGTAEGKPLSDPVPPGSSVVRDYSTLLTWTRQMTLRLQGSDGFGGIWYVDGLNTGRHLLHVVYRNRISGGNDDIRIWTGEAALPAVEIKMEAK